MTTDHGRASDLLRHGVPLSLLFDLAGLGPTSEELYRSETPRPTGPAHDQSLLVAVAS